MSGICVKCRCSLRWKSGYSSTCSLNGSALTKCDLTVVIPAGMKMCKRFLSKISVEYMYCFLHFFQSGCVLLPCQLVLFLRARTDPHSYLCYILCCLPRQLYLIVCTSCGVYLQYRCVTCSETTHMNDITNIMCTQFSRFKQNKNNGNPSPTVHWLKLAQTQQNS